MARLTAEFTIPLPSPLLTSFAEVRRYDAEIDGFDVSVCLLPTDDGRWKLAGQSTWIHEANFLKIAVSHEDRLDPPEVAADPTGMQDWTPQSDFLEERKPGYQKAALIAVNRLIRFYKYRLRNPSLRELSLRTDGFEDPAWTDGAGRPLQGIRCMGVIDGAKPSQLDRLGARELTPQEEPDLEEALKGDLTVEIHEELLSDAQAAIIEGNFRRAVLEMAVACEVAIKRAYFGQSTAATAAYEYLEDKGGIRITPIELISGAAHRAFGEGFEDVSPGDYKHIDFLFRCRNKVAHRADPVYRDDKNVLHQVDGEEILHWWASVDRLLTWLKRR